MKSLQVLSLLGRLAAASVAILWRTAGVKCSQCLRGVLLPLLLVSRFIALLQTGLDVENRCPKRLALCSGVQDERDNQAVKSKNFAENQDEYHAHEDSRLLHVRANARVTNNANSVACSKTSQAYTQTAAQVQETVEQTVCLLRRRAHVTSDQDGNH